MTFTIKLLSVYVGCALFVSNYHAAKVTQSNDWCKGDTWVEQCSDYSNTIFNNTFSRFFFINK